MTFLDLETQGALAAPTPPPEAPLPALPPADSAPAALAPVELAPAEQGDRCGPYELLACLGEGAMGRVFRARGPDGRVVALKTLHAHIQERPDSCARFLREGRALERIDHPGVVRFVSCGRDEHLGPYVAMEFVEGRDLGEVLAEEGPLPLHVALDCFFQLCRAMRAAHAAGVVHRDLKPGNLLVDGEGRVKVGDFGLARREQDSLFLTRPGQVMGTPHFMSPELARGRSVDARSDLYAQGCLLFLLLTGELPFPEPNVHNVLVAHCTSPRPDPCEGRPEVPAALGRITTRLMAIEPAARYPDNDALLGDLHEALGLDPGLDGEASASPAAASLTTAPTPACPPFLPPAAEVPPPLAATLDALPPVVSPTCTALPPCAVSAPPRPGETCETQLAPVAPEEPGPAPGRPALRPAGPPPRPAGEPERVGRYRIVEELGRGGMGVVYRAHDPELGRDVAIKMVLARHLGGTRGSALRRFQEEARAAGRLRHPHLVSVHEVGTHEGCPYLVMDFVPGETLCAARARGPLPPRQVARIVARVAEALAVAHAAGIVHRDVKPENVLLDAERLPYLTDFGVARDLGREDLTVEGQLLGTPTYAAPEQARGELGIGPAVDVYALGGLLHFALAGEPPFSADSILALMGQIQGIDPQPLREIDSGVHPDLETIALRCLEKEPEQRYPSAGEVAAELERFLAGEPIAARPLTRTQRWRRWARRNRLLAGVLAASVGAIGLLLVAGAVGALASFHALQEAWREAELRAEEASREAAAARAAEEDARRKLRLAQEKLGQLALNEGDAQRAASLLVASLQGPEPQAPARRAAALQALARVWSSRLLEGHDARISVLAPAPGSGPVASVDAQGGLRLWGRDGQLLHRDEDAGQRDALAWSSEGRLFACASRPPGPEDSPPAAAPFLPLSVWTRNGVRLRELPACAPFAWDPRGARLVAALPEGGLGGWDARSGNPVAAPATVARVRALAWAPGGTQLAFAEQGGALRLWGRAVMRLLARDAGELETLAWSAGGKLLAGVGSDGLVRVWDVAGAGPPRELAFPLASSRPLLAWSPTQRLLAGAAGRTLRVWSWPGGEVLAELEGHGAGIRSLAWSPDGKQLASAGADRTVRVWDPAEGRALQVLRGHGGSVGSVRWLSEDALLSAASDATLRLWERPTRPAFLELLGRGELVDGWWSPVEGKRVLRAPPARGGCELWDARTGARLGLLQHPGEDLSAAAWSPGGGRLATGGARGTLRGWRAEGALEFELAAHRAPVEQLVWSPNGARLASAAGDGSLRIGDGHGNALRVVPPGRLPWSALRWNPVDDSLAGIRRDGTLHLWSGDDGRELGQVRTEREELRHAVWAPDGRLLALSGKEGSVDLRRAGDLSRVELVPSRGGALNSLGWAVGEDVLLLCSPLALRTWSRGRQRVLREEALEGPHLIGAVGSRTGRLALARDDGLMRVWEPGLGSERELVGCSARIADLAWSPDGSHLAALSGKGRDLWVWRFPQGSLVAELRCGDDVARPLSTRVRWSPQGNQLLSLRGAGCLGVWRSEPALKGPAELLRGTEELTGLQVEGARVIPR